MKNILVATDFSPEAHYAFQVAVQLARQTGGHLTLLHVLDAIEDAGGGFSTTAAPVGEDSINQIFAIKLIEATKRRLNALAAESLRLAPNVPVHEAVEVARVGEGILAAIGRHATDLVVLGARGHGAMENFFVSSTTERLIRLAACPVLTVKHPHAGYEVKHIVFPSDFSAEAERALDGLRAVRAAFPQATLHLLHVAAGSGGHIAEQQMQAFAEQHQLGDCETTEVDASRTSAGIEDYAKQIGADLVVIPTHVRSGLSRFLQASIAETVATHAFPPVLTYHFAGE
jgi:nucleotide-binding universal stress UspA family protein